MHPSVPSIVRRTQALVSAVALVAVLGAAALVAAGPGRAAVANVSVVPTGLVWVKGGAIMVPKLADPEIEQAFTTARVTSGSVELLSAPGKGGVLARLGATSEFGSPRTLSVVERRGRWRDRLGRLARLDAPPRAHAVERRDRPLATPARRQSRERHPPQGACRRRSTRLADPDRPLRAHRQASRLTVQLVVRVLHPCADGKAAEPPRRLAWRRPDRRARDRRPGDDRGRHLGRLPARERTRPPLPDAPASPRDSGLHPSVAHPTSNRRS
jgi:hypothetical protein